MTPFNIEVLMHYNSRATDFRDGDFSAPAASDAIAGFVAQGILVEKQPRNIIHDDAQYTITEKGRQMVERIRNFDRPVPMLLWCPECSHRHIDEGNFALKDHHTHACQHCGHVWRPAVGDTVGVQFLPGFKN